MPAPFLGGESFLSPEPEAGRGREQEKGIKIKYTGGGGRLLSILTGTKMLLFLYVGIPILDTSNNRISDNGKNSIVRDFSTANH